MQVLSLPIPRTRESLVNLLLQAAIIIAFGLFAVAATKFSLREPLLAVGLVYVAGYMVVAWKYPHIALMMIFAAGPIQTNLGEAQEGGTHFSIAEVNLALLMPVFAIKCALNRKWPRVGPLWFFLFLHFAVCFFSSAHIWRPSTPMAMAKMGLYLVCLVTLFAEFIENPKKHLISFYVVLAIGIVLGGTVLVTKAQYFLGLHKNGVGGSLAATLVIGCELFLAARSRKARWLLMIGNILMAGGLVFTLSRGAWIAAFFGVLFITLLRGQFKLLLLTALLLSPIVALCWQLLPEEDRSYATGFDSGRANIQARYISFAMAKRYFEQNPIIGNGVGLRKEIDAHNWVMITLAETGMVGLASFILLNCAVFYMLWNLSRYLPTNSPVFSILTIAGGLMLGRLMHGLVDHYWSRGPIMMAWAAVGMVVCVQHYLIRHGYMRKGAL